MTEQIAGQFASRTELPFPVGIRFEPHEIIGIVVELSEVLGINFQASEAMRTNK